MYTKPSYGMKFHKNMGLNQCNNPYAFVEYSSDLIDVCKSIGSTILEKKLKIS